MYGSMDGYWSHTDFFTPRAALLFMAVCVLTSSATEKLRRFCGGGARTWGAATPGDDGARPRGDAPVLQVTSAGTATQCCYSPSKHPAQMTRAQPGTLQGHGLVHDAASE